MVTGAASRNIIRYSEDDFIGLRAAGRLAAETLDMITPHVVAGARTGDLDSMIHQFTLDHNAVPAPLNYRGFPKSCCISINHVVCHGIPGDRRLAEGDIVNIDVTSILNGWYGDTSRMFYVGKVPRKAISLVEKTHEAMMRGIHAVRPGARLGDVGHAIQSYAEGHRLSVVRDFCGHGIGRTFHDAPHVLHYGKPDTGVELDVGMVFTIEPMLNIGRYDVKVLDDGWTAVTRDRSLSAQFEHMIGVTHDGCEIFTKSPSGYDVPPYGDTGSGN